MRAHRSYIGIGANVGDAPASVRGAFGALEDLGTVLRRSSLYRSPPWGKTDQPDFVNAVALLQTPLGPSELLLALKAIEVRLGRVTSERWGPRVIDLDILAYDDRTIEEPGLRIPHASLADRAFVLVPLAEIDSRYRPQLDALPGPERANVRRIG